MQEAAYIDPDSKVHEANMGPTWVLSAPDGPHEPCYQGRHTGLALESLYLILNLSISCEASIVMYITGCFTLDS